MKLVALLMLVSPCWVKSFAPAPKQQRSDTKLNMQRREVLSVALLGFVQPVVAADLTRSPQAGIGSDRDFANDFEYISAQRKTGNALDVNSAFVGDYKALPGMFPTVAGKIASHGPYDSVKDLYKIEGLTSRDVAIIKKYEKYFVANPATLRIFNERINARVST